MEEEEDMKRDLEHRSPRVRQQQQIQHQQHDDLEEMPVVDRRKHMQQQGSLERRFNETQQRAAMDLYSQMMPQDDFLRCKNYAF